MKVRFEFSAADLADVSSRTVDRSPPVQKWRRTGRWAWAILVGLLAFALTPGELGLRVAVGLLAAVALAVFFAWRARERKASKRLLAFYRERLAAPSAPAR